MTVEMLQDKTYANWFEMDWNDRRGQVHELSTHKKMRSRIYGQMTEAAIVIVVVVCVLLLSVLFFFFFLWQQSIYQVLIVEAAFYATICVLHMET